MKTRETIRAALLDPFAPADVKWKPQMVKNNRALAMAYIDARAVQDRLDEVLGVDGWQEKYTILQDGSVMCRLTVRFWDVAANREVVTTKADVGSASQQPDAGDRLKAAFSDALKRAAVKFGVGRYLYRLSSQWVDYDPTKKAFVNKPQLPAHALPERFRPAGVELADKITKLAIEYCKAARLDAAAYTGDLMKQLKYDAKTSIKDMKTVHANAMLRKVGADIAAHAAGNPADFPKSGKELHERLAAQDAKMAGAKQIKVGELLAHVTAAGVKAGYASNIASWTGEAAVKFGVECATAFIKAVPAAANGTGKGGAENANTTVNGANAAEKSFAPDGEGDAPPDDGEFHDCGGGYADDE